ncbi:hypothetical protein [Flavobacteriaceae bacterium 14752]|uniref:hypothetical protein n=1 Tax=Mesohalobacter salilacus TaxID=2491711 RepID=UPI000F645075|nr:hypothetical protein EIG84_05860 [Flavobacteriaceae bacterium 14752]
MQTASKKNCKDKGFLGRMWCKTKNFVEDNAGTIVGGLIGGFAGALIGKGIDKFIVPMLFDTAQRLNIQLNEDLASNFLLEEWAENFMDDLIFSINKPLIQASDDELKSKQIIDHLNSGLFKLSVLKAYYDFNAQTKKLKGTLKAVEEQKAVAVQDAIVKIVESYNEAVEGVNSPYVMAEKPFKPSKQNKISGLNLDWKGASVDSNRILYVNKNANNTGATVITNPETGGNTPVSIDQNQNTNTNNNSSGTTKETSDQAFFPTNQPTETNTQKEDKNKYWLIGGALVLAALIFRGKN